MCSDFSFKYVCVAIGAVDLDGQVGICGSRSPRGTDMHSYNKYVRTGADKFLMFSGGCTWQGFRRDLDPCRFFKEKSECT